MVQERPSRERAQPLYTPRTPRPSTWRPGRLTKSLLGTFPGVRTLALDDAQRGLPFTVLGVAIAIAFLVVAIGWSGRHIALAPLRISDRVELLDAVCLLVLLSGFEGLRLVEELERRTRRPWGPRVVAALFFPAALGTCLLPGLVHLGPRLLEAVWWAFAVTAIGSSPAYLYCLLEEHVHTGEERGRVLRLWSAAVVLAVIAVVIAGQVAPDLLENWSEAAVQAGYRLLPAVLGREHDV